MDPFRYAEAFSSIGLLFVCVPSPAEVPRTEDDEEQAAQGEQDVGYEEVFEVHDGGAFSHGGDTSENVESQGTGQREDHHEEAVCDASFFPVHFHGVHGHAYDVFEDGQDGGEGRKAQKEEKEASPELAQGHARKDVGQGDEDEAGAGAYGHVIRKAAGNDDEAGCHGYESVQQGDVHGFGQQGMVLVYVGAEDGHGADAQRECEEGLVHGPFDDVDPADFTGGFPVGQQEVAESFLGAGGEYGVYGQHDHDDQQGAHHPFGDFFQTGLQALGTNEKAGYDDDEGVDHEACPVCEHVGEVGGDLGGGQAGESAGEGVCEIPQHPAADDGVEHHEQPVAGDHEGGVPVPGFLFWDKPGVQAGGGGLCGTAHGEFHGHDGQAEYHQKQQVEQQEYAAAVGSGHIGEFPYIADADGTACRQEDESEAGSEFFTFHIFSPLKKAGLSSLFLTDGRMPARIQISPVIAQRIFADGAVLIVADAAADHDGLCLGDVQGPDHVFLGQAGAEFFFHPVRQSLVFVYGAALIVCFQLCGETGDHVDELDVVGGADAFQNIKLFIGIQSEGFNEGLIGMAHFSCVAAQAGRAPVNHHFIGKTSDFIEGFLNAGLPDHKGAAAPAPIDHAFFFQAQYGLAGRNAGDTINALDFHFTFNFVPWL